MSAEVNSNPPPAPTESKSARKKREKVATAAANGGEVAPAMPAERSREDSSVDAKADGEGGNENLYIKELQKNIRNINKKLTGMQKTDSIIAENPGISLDDLVAQKKINSDQRASALKKPLLQQQLEELKEQITQYKQFDADFQKQLLKQRDELSSAHKTELDRLREEVSAETAGKSKDDVRKMLLTFSQFLRAAAAKRQIEEEADTEESKAFEGALLLVYGGDEKAVDAAVNLIEGTDEAVPSIEGVPLSIKYSHIQRASLAHAPFQVEETWVDSVAEANAAAGALAEAEGHDAVQAPSDPTITNAGLTEFENSQPNGVAKDHHELASAVQGSAGDEAGNKAGDAWDTNAAGATAGAETEMDQSFEMVPRDPSEVDKAVDPGANGAGTSWADDTSVEPPTGNKAAESWDTNPKEVDNSLSGAVAPTKTSGTAESWADGANDAAASAQDDGFSEVPGRHRGGRGGFRGRGDGEFRGRGRGRGGYRGDGEFRGRGRGGGFRGGRGDGEFRGRGGRGRGPRGDSGPHGDGAPRSATAAAST